MQGCSDTTEHDKLTEHRYVATSKPTGQLGRVSVQGSARESRQYPLIRTYPTATTYSALFHDARTSQSNIFTFIKTQIDTNLRELAACDKTRTGDRARLPLTVVAVVVVLLVVVVVAAAVVS